MKKPIVKVKEKKYSVGNFSVVLKLNSGPLIHLRLSEKLDGANNKLSNEETFKQEFFQDIAQEQEGSFEWAGKTLNFILVGYKSSEARNFDLVGLVVNKSLIKWFNENNFKNKQQKYLIYQKNKGNSWPFFNKILGDKFDKPNQDFIDRLDLLFPEHGCICRYRDSNNFHFLNRAIAFASRHLPDVQGWCAFNADKPLRLILFEENKQGQTIPKLDQTWNPSYSFLPNRYSWNRWLNESCTLSREISIKKGQEIELIQKLVSDGSNGEDEKKGQNFQDRNPTRLLFSPGTINIGNRNIFCHTVSYEFKLPAFGEEETPSVTMKMELNYPERQIGDNEVISLRLSGKFKEWTETKENTKIVKIAPCDLNIWGIVNESDRSLKHGDDAVLYTQILSPTYSDTKYSGIYIKHEKDDEMILDINPCGIPLVLGSVQKYRKELEEADVTLCGQKIAISVSPDNQGLDKSEAIILDNQQIKFNHNKEITGNATEKIDLVSAKDLNLNSSQVSINSQKQVDINSNKTEIKSLVNISAPAPGNQSSKNSGKTGSSSSTVKNGSSANGTDKTMVAANNAPNKGSNDKEDEAEDKKEEKDIITIDDRYHFKVGSASGENNLCLLDTLAQLAVEQTPYEGTAEELKKQFQVFLADDTSLIEVGPEQDFRDRNISENFLLTLSHQFQENYQIQIYEKSDKEKNQIKKYKVYDVRKKDTGELQYPEKKIITLNILYKKIEEEKHHFEPLFYTKEQGIKYISVKEEIPAVLEGGGAKQYNAKEFQRKFIVHAQTIVDAAVSRSEELQPVREMDAWAENVYEIVRPQDKIKCAAIAKCVNSYQMEDEKTKQRKTLTITQYYMATNDNHFGNYQKSDKIITDERKPIKIDKIRYDGVQKDIHAEMKIVQFLWEKELLNRTVINYIGITKPCCYLCTVALNAAGINVPGQTRGSHGQRFDWTIPRFILADENILQSFLGEEAYELWQQYSQDGKNTAMTDIKSGVSG